METPRHTTGTSPATRQRRRRPIRQRPARPARESPAKPGRAALFDPDTARRLKSGAREERMAAWKALYEQDCQSTGQPKSTTEMARRELAKYQLPIRSGGPDHFAAEAWLRLGVHIEREPLALDSGFPAYLRQIVRNVIVDAWRKETGRPSLTERLRRARDGRCDTDLERMVVQSMMDLVLDYRHWNDVAELAQRSGATEEEVTAIVEWVRPRVDEPPPPPPPFGPNTARLREALFKRIETIFPSGGGQVSAVPERALPADIEGGACAPRRSRVPGTVEQPVPRAGAGVRGRRAGGFGVYRRT